MAANNDDNDEQQPEIGEYQQAVRSSALLAMSLSSCVRATLRVMIILTLPSTVKIFDIRLPEDLLMQQQMILKALL